MDDITLAKRFDAMRFDLERSIRYWSSRSVVWSGLVQAASITTAITGSAAIATLANESNVMPIIFAAVASLCGIFSAAFDAPSRARFCIERISLYSELLARCPLDGCSSKETEDLLSEIRAARLRLEASETVVLECLDVICHNKVCVAMGREESKHRLTWFQRVVGRILPIPYVEPVDKEVVKMGKLKKVLIGLAVVVGIVVVCVNYGCTTHVAVSGYEDVNGRGASGKYCYWGCLWNDRFWEQDWMEKKSPTNTLGIVRSRTNYGYSLISALTFGAIVPVDVEWELNADDPEGE